MATDSTPAPAYTPSPNQPGVQVQLWLAVVVALLVIGAVLDWTNIL